MAASGPLEGRGEQTRIGDGLFTAGEAPPEFAVRPRRVVELQNFFG